MTRQEPSELLGQAPDAAAPEPLRFPRLLVPAACAWIGAALCTATPAVAVIVACVSFLVAVFGAVWAVAAGRRSGRTGGAARLIAWILIGTCCVAAVGVVATVVAQRAPDRQPTDLVSLGAAALEVDLQVTADGVLAAAAGGAPSVRFSAELVTASADGSHRVDGRKLPVMVFAPVVADALPRIGERWRAAAILRWNDPGDARAALLFARTPAVRLAGPPGTIDWANRLRIGLVDVSAALPGAGGELLPGLAIGDVSRVGETVGTAMQLSSLSHLTAVSGANCALIVWLVSAGSARLGAGRVLRLVLALSTLLAFVVLVTPQPSVQRAALMATIVLLMGGFGRPTRGLAALSLAVIVLLVGDPWLAGQYGFGLSVLATAGLLLLSRPLAEVLARWLPSRLAMVIAVPTAAQLACQPMLVLLDPAIQLGGVPANLLAGPAAAPATMLGLVACLVAVVSVPLATGVAWLGWLPATWIGAVAQWFASVSSARLPWPEGGVGVVLLAAPTGAVVVLLLFGRRVPAALRTGLQVGLVLFAVVVGGCSVGAGLGTALHRPGDWTVAACDVGQGDAVLVRSGGAVALVDVGPDPVALSACLDELGIDRIDLLVLTHYDLDHVGGLSAVVGRVDETLLGPVDDPEDERIARSLRQAGSAVRSAEAGDEGALSDGPDTARWQVLWPDAAAGRIEPGNDASVVVRFDLPDTSILLLGDLGEDAQDRLLARHSLGSTVDIVKVSHHGSADQSERLARRIDADLALVSVGASNGYGHPTRAALDLYEASGASVLRTDVLGTIVVSPRTAEGFRVWSSHPEVASEVDVGGRR